MLSKEAQKQFNDLVECEEDEGLKEVLTLMQHNMATGIPPEHLLVGVQSNQLAELTKLVADSVPEED